MKYLILIFIKLTSLFCYAIGRPLSRQLFGLLGIVWFDILRIRRKDIIRHISIAFPEWTEEKKIETGRKSLIHLSAQLADFFILPFVNQAWIDKYVVIEGRQNIENELSNGTGAFLLGMHVGHGDLSANIISKMGIKFFLITKFFKNKTFNDIWFSIRGFHGVHYIEPHGEKTPFQILKALKVGGAVGFVLDQFMGKPYGIETQFFGVKTGSAQGLALFYLKTKRPIVPVYSYESDEGKFHLVFEKALDLSPYLSEDKEDSIRKLTQYFCDITQGIIRKHPEHWMWLHRRWKKFE